MLLCTFHDFFLIVATLMQILEKKLQFLDTITKLMCDDIKKKNIVAFQRKKTY